jgi:O-antigen ligase
MLAALVLTQRRVAYVTLAICAVYFALVLAGAARRAYLRLALPVVVIGALYVAAFTGSSGPLARPIERAWSLVDDANTSNLYRIVELQNLRHTIHTHPWGIGFGHPYEMLQPLPNIPFQHYEYVPHNEVLWIWVKAGTLGFILVMFYFARLVGESVWTYRRARDPLLRAVAVVVGLAIVNQLVASYFELQLTYARNMIYLGALVGLLGPIRQWSGLAPDKIGWRL